MCANRSYRVCAPADVLASAAAAQSPAPAPASAATQPPPQRSIGPDRPLFLACAYGTARASINRTLYGYRRCRPEEVKPFFCPTKSFGGKDGVALDLVAQAGLRVLSNNSLGRSASRRIPG